MLQTSYHIPIFTQLPGLPSYLLLRVGDQGLTILMGGVGVALAGTSLLQLADEGSPS